MFVIEGSIGDVTNDLSASSDHLRSSKMLSPFVVSKHASRQ